MQRATARLKATSLWALFVILMALASARASAQPCCDLVVEVDPDVNCCVTIDSSRWSDGNHPGGTFCPSVGFVRIPVPCPNTLFTVTIQTASGPVIIPFGAANQYVEIARGCCVYISLDNNWPPAPCYRLKIRKADCR